MSAESRPIVILIGAFERDNLGDLLFPKIISRLLPDYTIIKASIIGADLTDIGGDIVYSIDAIKNAHLPNIVAVIHCGGETIPCSADFALKMDTPIHLFDNNKLIEHHQSRSFFSDISNPLAYIYDYHDLKLDPTIPFGCISIGGTNLDNTIHTSLLSALSRRLKNSKTIYIRDSQTKTILHKLFNISPPLSPDIVSLIAHTHRSEIQTVSSSTWFNRYRSLMPYFVFQCNEETLGKIGIARVAQTLSIIASKYQHNIVVQPMGIGINHGSIIQLRHLTKISNQQTKSKIIYQSSRHIWKQTTVLSQSKLNIGTSLHLRIISSAFSVPGVTISNPKVKHYLTTWYPSTLQNFVTSLDHLPQVIDNTLSKSNDDLTLFSDKTCEQTLSTLKNFFTQLHLHPKLSNFHKSGHKPSLAISNQLLLHQTHLLQHAIFKNLQSSSNISLSTEITSSKFFQLWSIYTQIKKFFKLYAR